MDNRMTAVLCCLKQQFSDGILFFCPAGAPRVTTVFQRKAVFGQQQKSAAVLFFSENCKKSRIRTVLANRIPAKNCSPPTIEFGHQNCNLPASDEIIDSKPVKICGFNFQDHKPLNTHALSLQTSGGGPRRERCLCRSSPACQQQSRYRSRWPP